MIRFILIFLTWGNFILSTESTKNKTKCPKILGELKHSQGEFLDCMVRNSIEPTYWCNNCAHDYKNLTSSYDVLVKKCSKEYIGNNRLDIVYNLQKSLVNIWQIGFCDDCFEDGEKSQYVLQFYNLSESLDGCTNNKDNKTICQLCQEDYQKLNIFYRQMVEEKKDKICFDLQDAMNITRLKWSHNFNCGREELSLTTFFIGSTIFCALPLIFYFGMFLYTKRIESNPEILDSTSETVSRLPADLTLLRNTET